MIHDKAIERENCHEGKSRGDYPVHMSGGRFAENFYKIPRCRRRPAVRISGATLGTVESRCSVVTVVYLSGVRPRKRLPLFQIFMSRFNSRGASPATGVPPSWRRKRRRRGLRQGNNRDKGAPITPRRPRT